MINWMQRHKKWLVITIWISTIAFVGAGFVGWGSYDFKKTGGDLAKVGNVLVSYSDVQIQYNILYNRHSQSQGSTFNNKIAQEMGLEEQAYDNAINNSLLINYAKEIGFNITNDEIAQELVKIPSFQKNGRFDKETYVQSLLNNKDTPIEFEDRLKSDLLANKVIELIRKFVTPLENEVKDINALAYLKDKLSVEVISIDPESVQIEDINLSKYWEENKNTYMSSTSYSIETYIIKNKDLDLNSTKNNMTKKKIKSEYKKYALKKYLKLKKGELKFSPESRETIYENKPKFSKENMDIIKKAQLGKILKPFLQKDDYIIVKVIDKFEPKILEYEKAKPSVLKDYRKILHKKELKIKAENSLQTFKGNDIGFVNAMSTRKIDNLTSNESLNFLSQLFTATTKKGIINVGPKAVLYNIHESKISYNETNSTKEVTNAINNIKFNTALLNLLNKLKNKYVITRY